MIVVDLWNPTYTERPVFSAVKPRKYKIMMMMNIWKIKWKYYPSNHKINTYRNLLWFLNYHVFFLHFFVCLVIINHWSLAIQWITIWISYIISSMMTKKKKFSKLFKWTWMIKSCSSLAIKCLDCWIFNNDQKKRYKIRRRWPRPTDHYNEWSGWWSLYVRGW